MRRDLKALDFFGERREYGRKRVRLDRVKKISPLWECRAQSFRLPPGDVRAVQIGADRHASEIGQVVQSLPHGLRQDRLRQHGHPGTRWRPTRGGSRQTASASSFVLQNIVQPTSILV